jgi:hypothetical protein
MDYRYITIIVIVLAGISIWLFYVSRVQYKLEHKLKRLQIDREFNEIMKRDDKNRLQEAYVEIALNKLRSADKKDKILGLRQIHEISWGASVDIKKKVITELILYVQDEDNEGMRIAVLDEICKLHNIVKKEF